jgi:Zn-dependent peptidase ImmA (M78 family)
VGFKNINQGNIVGLTTYGFGFREIDISIDFWNSSTSLSRAALVFHEMGHAYCHRDHDYGNGTEYGDADKARKDPNKEDGFYEDSCPVTLLFPEVVEDNCFEKHYEGYVTEIFNRCVPW